MLIDPQRELQLRRYGRYAGYATAVVGGLQAADRVYRAARRGYEVYQGAERAFYAGKRKFEWAKDAYGNYTQASKKRKREIIAAKQFPYRKMSYGKYMSKKGSRSSKRRRRGRRGKGRGVSRSVQAYINKRLNQSAVQEYREFSSGQLTGSINQCSYSSQIFLTNTGTESIVNATNPTIGTASLTWMDATTAANNCTIKTKKGSFARVTYMNNFGFAVKVCLWSCCPKIHTSTTPESSIEKGLDDLFVEPDAQALIVDIESKIAGWPSDSKIFRRFYKVYKKVSFTLGPGEQKVYYHNLPGGTYSPDANDIVASSYRKGFTSFILQRIQGLVIHDTTNNALVGTSNVQVDYTMDLKWKYVVGRSNYAKKIQYHYDTDAVAVAEQMARTGVELIDAPADPVE